MHGLIRAITVIARAELERVGYFETPLDETEQRSKIEQVIEVLRQWSGFDGSKSGWLECYYKEVVDSLGQKETLSWEEIITKMSKQYETTIVESLNRKVQANTMLTGSYEKIIANAIYLGPLKRYYLVCKKGAQEALENNGNPLSGKSKKDCEKADNVIRLVAAYLLKKRLTGMKSNQVNLTDLANWAQCKQIRHSSSAYFGALRVGVEGSIPYKRERIYSSETINKNITKFVVNPKYLEEFDFSLVAEEDFDGVPEGYMFFSDFGAGNKLQKNKKYEPLKRKMRKEDMMI